MINSNAIECKFQKREARKVKNTDFVYGLIKDLVNGGNSLMSLAITIGLMIDDTVSKVAVNKKFTEELISLLKTLLSHVITMSLEKSEKIVDPKLFRKFTRVFACDSTSFPLPEKAKGKYPGGGNQHKKIAMARIQLAYDILRGTPVRYQITPYTENDQSASEKILPFLRKDDLLIWDLGYFSLKVFRSIIGLGAFFISRLKYNVCIFSAVNGKPIDLVKTLRKGEKLDIQVKLGKKEKVPVRLVAIPLSDSVANERRRKVKEKMKKDSRSNYSKEHLFLLGWGIYITNVDEETWKEKDIFAIYSLRWCIEIIFKSWKSGLKFLTIPDANPIRIEAYLLAKLIIITIIHAFYYKKISMNSNPNEMPISILKMMSIFRVQFSILNLFFGVLEITKADIQKQIQYHCKYEKRCSRMNHYQALASLG